MAREPLLDSDPRRVGRYRLSARRTAFGIIALILALAVAGGGTAVGLALAGPHHKPKAGGPGSPAASTPAAAVPVLIATGYRGRRPAEIDFSVDSGNVVTGITWSSWTATRAIGSGTSDIDSCVPSCAAAPADLVATQLVLSQPVDGHFTVISEVRDGTTEAFVYPSAWALNAS